jgi:hypothetical protein
MLLLKTRVRWLPAKECLRSARARRGRKEPILEPQVGMACRLDLGCLAPESGESILLPTLCAGAIKPALLEQGTCKGTFRHEWPKVRHTVAVTQHHSRPQQRPL